MMMLYKKYVQEEMNYELSLILDLPKRWNSMLDMLECFHAIKNPVWKCLIDLNSDIHFSDA